MILFISCGGNGGGTSSKPSTLDDAWDEFEAGRYNSAVSVFKDVLESDPSQNDANNGLGWSFAFAGQLDSAQSYFDIALATLALKVNSTSTDAHAGLASVNLASQDLSGAIAHASLALEEDSDWEFEHATGVDHRDLKLILAQAYFAQGEPSFQFVQTQLDELDPENGLDSADPNSWNGLPTYAAALLRALQKVEENVGSEMIL